MDTGAIEIDYLFDDDSTAPTREAMRDSARAELEALRRAVATIRPELDNAGAAVEEMRDFMQNAERMDNVDIRELIEDGRTKR